MVALRFRRFRIGKSRPRRRLLSVRPVPTLITLGNLLCGFGAIILSMRAHNPPQGWDLNQCLYWAGILIFAGMIFDMLDGRIARLTKTASRFGLEMDSLCDVVTFGVAPAVVVKAALDALGPNSIWLLDRYVWPLMAVYVCCAALRLARYNVEAGSSHSDVFFGIPSPAAAGCVASLVVLITSAPTATGPFSIYLNPVSWPSQVVHGILLSLPFLMLLLGVLMVTRVRYIHAGDRLLGGKKSFMHLMMLGLGIVLVIMQHEIVLVLAFNGYLVSGLLNEAICQLKPRQESAKANAQDPTDEATKEPPPAGSTESQGHPPETPTEQKVS
jgi:CDP-diacylglycerol--serine O-phosphatidyltransferase